MSERKPIISFCIPTYNRESKVKKMVTNILDNCLNQEIEVVVLDNCSTDSTFSSLNSITDSRFSYYRNNKPIIGPLNIIKSLTYAKGKYAFICLDKDKIETLFLGTLLNQLTSEDSLVFGYCRLNINCVESDIYFKKGFESLANMSYLSMHPTGMFYNTDYFKLINYEKIIIDDNEIFGFYPDLLNAEMALYGDSKIIGLPIFNTESREDCEAIPSYTFKRQEDLFFTPMNRSKTFLIYAKHLVGLNILNKEKFKILSRLYHDELISSTIVFKGVLKDYSICKHYNVKTRNINIFEIIKIDLFFSYNFLKQNLTVSLFRKLLIIINQHLVILRTVISSKLIKIN